MNHSEVVKRLAERLKLSQREIKNLLDNCTKVFKRTLDEDTDFSIPELGTFKTQLREKRKSYNPHYEKYTMLPPKRVVNFSPSSVIKDKVKSRRIENE